MFDKEYLIKLLTEEQEQFNKYMELCAIYQTTTDPIVQTRHKAIMETLNKILKALS